MLILKAIAESRTDLYDEHVDSGICPLGHWDDINREPGRWLGGRTGR